MADGTSRRDGETSCRSEVVWLVGSHVVVRCVISMNRFIFRLEDVELA